MNSLSGERPAEDVSAGRDAILLVEDDLPLLNVLSRGLGLRFLVSTAASAKEAEKLLLSRTFKVIISDHLMPGGNGLDFLIRAREEHPRTQRILMTGFMKPEMLRRGVEEAAIYRYLLKPISMPEFVRTVEQAVELYDEDA